MTQLETIRQHHRLCDEIHQCVLDENRFLRNHQRPLEPEALKRKRAMLERLDESLSALRALPAASARDPETRSELETTRARILQILQLDKENEHLLVRCSLSNGHSTPAQTPSVSMLKKIYARCA